jgi:hypothetical protein
MSGQKDLSTLFKRVTALEQREDDDEQAVNRIIKHYANIGLTVTIRAHTHQYRLCGDTNPIYGAVTATDTYI